MKKSLLAAGIACALSLPTQADIFISEIIEGSSFNKAVEIANTGSSAVTLTGYTIAHSTNGGVPLEDLATGSTFDLSDVTIEAGDVYVIANAKADTEILNKADDTSSGNPVNFNGDDPIALFIDGVVHDVAGEFGDVDWNKDITLVRSFDQTPKSVYNSADWQTLAKDNSEGLGSISSVSDSVEETAPEYDAEATIMALQGNSTHSPYTDPDNYQYSSEEVFKVTGVVTHIQTAALGNDLPIGFFMQDAVGDDNTETSDGIFVNYSGVASLGLTLGAQVNVYGSVTESYDWTQLSAEFIEVTSTNTPITATVIEPIDSDENFEATLERYEGMLIELDTSSDMKITRTFGFDFDSYRNNMVLAHGKVNRQPNQDNQPGSEKAIAQTETNALNRLFIESPTAAEDGIIPWYPNFGADNGTGTTDDYLRVGANVNGMQGVLGYSYSEFRLYVDNELNADNFDHSNVARTTEPDIENGDLKIATFNVLNYFNSAVDGAENPNGSNRGAESADDLAMQTDKIVNAIIAIDADFIGLMEVENNGFGEDSAIVALVSALNEKLEPNKQYTIASSSDYDYIGTDAITNQAIYRANKLSLDEFDVIEMPQQHAPSVSYVNSTESGDNYMRNAVTPTFTVLGTNKKLTISVNHLKSKGSVCYEDVVTGEEINTDLQGSCENLRVSGAFQLATKLAEKVGYTMIIGDLNAYANEDPILLLTNQDNIEAGYQLKAAAYTYIGGDENELGEVLHYSEGAILTNSYGYIDTLAQFEKDGLSYSYNDEVGTLDYILVNDKLSSLVVDAAHWNINASESGFFQYDYSYGDVNIYDDAYRSSDHDPAIITLNFGLDTSLGEYIDLPQTPIAMPEQMTTVSENGVFSVIVNLTASSTGNLATGTKVVVVVSEDEANTKNSLSTQTATIDLTATQIAQGWASVDVNDVKTGSVLVSSYVGEDAVATAVPYTLTVAGETDSGTDIEEAETDPEIDTGIEQEVDTSNQASGGSSDIFTLLSLLGFAGWRLKRRKQ